MANTNTYSEEKHLGLWLTGMNISGSWAHKDEETSFYMLKAHVENILVRIGIKEDSVVTETSQNDVFVKGLVIKNRGGKVLAEMGIVNNAIQKKFGIINKVYYADLNWTLLMKATKKNTVSFREISKYPAVSRDLALLLDSSVDFAQVEDVAHKTERKLLKQVSLFDVYEGKNLPEGKKSYAVNFVLQDDSATLNDKKIDAIMNNLINNLKKQLGAELR